MGKLFTRRNLLLVNMCLLALLGITIYVLVFKVAAEARLNSNGSAFELNPDDAGRLWISDYKAKQIWGIDPISGSYDVYAVSGSPVDARQVGGYLWWADGLSNLLGRVSISDGTFTQWQVPDASGFLGTNLDTEVRLYVTDSSNPYLYRLDPNQAELCSYTLPGFGASNYIVHDGDYLWLGDSFDSTILRLQISDNTLTWWTLTVRSSPFGMVVDTQGNLWYADQGLKMLSRFDPTTNQLTSYALPKGNYPQMIAIQSGMIWYTEQSLPSLGRLDPLVAKSTSLTLTMQDQQLTPSCASISPSGTGTIPSKKGKLSWRNMTFTTIMNTDGWQIYQMPEGSDPWGIAISDFGYVVDSGRQVLVRFVPPQELPPIALETRAVTPSTTISQAQTPVPTAFPTQIPRPEYFRAYLPIIFKDRLFSP